MTSSRNLRAIGRSSRVRAAAIACLAGAVVVAIVIATFRYTTTTRRGSPSIASTSLAALFVSPSGSDTGSCSQAAPCASLNGAYQLAKAGQTISVAAGTYPNQVIQSRADLRNLSCTQQTPSSCVHIVGSGVTINGSLEIHGADVWVDGGQSRGGPYGITVTGYTDTESDSTTSYPDHVVVSGVHTTSFGILNANTVAFEDMDCRTGDRLERLHDPPGPRDRKQDRRRGREHDRDPHQHHRRRPDHPRPERRRRSDRFRLSLRRTVSANGKRAHDQKHRLPRKRGLQRPDPELRRHTPRHQRHLRPRLLRLPVDWLYNGAGCDNQSSIQFDGTFPNITIKNSAFAEPRPGYSCAVPPCDLSVDSFEGNTYGPTSTTAPPTR